jgi:hypothetical protein
MPRKSQKELLDKLAGTGGDDPPFEGVGIGPGNIVNPATFAGDGGQSETGKARGWPKGKPRQKRATSKTQAVDLSSLEGLLFSIHTGLSILLKAPELVLDETEVGLLCRAGEKVARHYDVPQFAEKTIDWANLVGCLFTVYGTRVIAMSARKRAPSQFGVTADTIVSPDVSTTGPFAPHHDQRPHGFGQNDAGGVVSQ